MKKGVILLFVFFMILSVAGCSRIQKHHKSSLPDPKTFNAHFPDMDKDDDGLVNWEEFETHFPHAEPGVFNALDLDGNKAVDHDEWHQFKEAHGLKHTRHKE